MSTTFLVNIVSVEINKNAYLLSGDDSIFNDLNISKNEYPKVSTTW